MRFTVEKLGKYTVSKGDLLICEGDDIGRAAIWNYNHSICIQNHIHRFRSYIPVSVELFYYVIFLYKLTDRINGNGIGMQGLPSNKLHSIIIPLPPVSEQRLISDRITSLFAIMNDLCN